MNKILFVKFVACILLITLIAAGISFTNMDFPFAIFFLIPLAIYSIQKGVHLFHILVLSVFASVAWIITNSLLSHYSLSFVMLLNGSLRFVIYFSLSYLLFLLTKQRNELTLKNKELIKLNNEKNAILGIAAHDIRNSSSAIFSFSEILLDNLKSKENLENEVHISSIINDSSDKLLRLVSNLLDLSKTESGQIHLNKILTDYNAFIESRIKLFSIIARK